MADVRTERDSMGTIEVPANRYWGAQTQRSLEMFRAGGERFRMPGQMICALGVIKKAAAITNCEQGTLSSHLRDLICEACDEVISGQLMEHFPLRVFQTGSGTQTNMNVNEVVANRAIELSGGELGSKDPVHPNDHVNMSQSSNDVFPSGMHLAALICWNSGLRGQLQRLEERLSALKQEFMPVVKVGRTHLQDATPITLGQEFSGWRAQVQACRIRLDAAAAELQHIPIGGTAVGTGLNTIEGFAERVCELISSELALSIKPTDNRFASMAAHDELANFSAALRTLAGTLMKIANDIRWLASGPRCGIGELNLPENEPGSSIMPGKINPTQCEALTMVCTQVYGNDTTISFAGSQGNFQLNVYKPVIFQNVMESLELLDAAIDSFVRYCLEGLKPDVEVIAGYLRNNLMQVTALVPHIGYSKAAEIANHANTNSLSLEDAAMACGISAEDFHDWVQPSKMTKPTPKNP